jgi:hypothetical protein
MPSASWTDFGGLSGHNRVVWIVQLLAMLLQQMVIEIHCVQQSITKHTLHLTRTLHHLLTDPQLGVLHLLHLSQLPVALIA